MEFQIRTLTKNDLVRGSGFFETLESLSTVGALSPEKALHIFDAMAHNTVILVAERENTIVGTTTIFFEPKFIHEGSFVGHIHDVATRKGYEGKGIGRALIAHAVSEAKRRGCYKVNLECAEHNIGFYEKCGFHRHETSMRKDL